MKTYIIIAHKIAHNNAPITDIVATFEELEEAQQYYFDHIDEEQARGYALFIYKQF